jgi:DNA (cytosine-5)-methyltransferase 1
MKVLSLFSGAGGFDIGLEAAGMTTAFQCEIDENCRQTLDYHWADVPKWDDVSTLTGKYILDHCDGVDVVAWGSPCQDLSAVGKREGLSGDKSILFHQGIRIIKELRELSNGKYPTWSIWENVTGALSSNGGADFGEVLYQMDEAGACFSEWAVLDAQYFGVPQRRRRVFVISCFDSAIAHRCPDKVLPVQKSDNRDYIEGRKKEQNYSCEIDGNVLCDAESMKNIFSYDQYNNSINKDIHHTIRAGTTQSTGVLVDGAVRRLTLVECERLMGWGDNHTLHRADGKQNMYTNRFKMCGNGVASPVTKWIGKQLMEIMGVQ